MHLLNGEKMRGKGGKCERSLGTPALTIAHRESEVSAEEENKEHCYRRSSEDTRVWMYVQKKSCREGGMGYAQFK